MISSRMNRANGVGRGPRVFMGILLAMVVGLVLLYYNEHRTARQVGELSSSLDVQTKSLGDSMERYESLKHAFGEEREQLTKLNIDLETKLDTTLRQSEDYRLKYDSVTSDKKSMEDQLVGLNGDVATLQQKLKAKEDESVTSKNEAALLREQISTAKQECEIRHNNLLNQQMQNLQSKWNQDKANCRAQINQCESALKTVTEHTQTLMKQQQSLPQQQLPQQQLPQQQLVKPSEAAPVVEGSTGQPSQSVHDLLTTQLRQKLLQHLNNPVPTETDNHQLQQVSTSDDDKGTPQNIANLFGTKSPKPAASVDDSTSLPGNDSQDHMMRIGISHKAESDNSDKEGVSVEQSNDDDDNNTLIKGDQFGDLHDDDNEDHSNYDNGEAGRSDEDGAANLSPSDFHGDDPNADFHDGDVNHLEDDQDLKGGLALPQLL